MTDDRIYVAEIAERIERILLYTTGGREDFFESLLIQDAVIRNFEVIGEATNKLSLELRQQYPDIPWRRIAGFRDVLIHDYMGIDLDEVWDVVCDR
ncbi:MAG: DUF86 domain-containing protein [Coleofasciculaceae cyanobacterium]